MGILNLRSSIWRVGRVDRSMEKKGKRREEKKVGAGGRRRVCLKKGERETTDSRAAGMVK